VTPVLGRSFFAEEDRLPGAHPVAIVSYRLWQQRFGSDPAVLGKTIRLSDHSLTVVGVAPSKFTGTFAGSDPAVYVPLATWAHIKGISLEKRIYDWLNLMGRLKPGVSREQAQAALRVTAERIHAVTPENTPTEIFAVDGSRGTNFWTEEDLWWPFAPVQAVTLLVLLVACANVTNLLLVRGITRQKEIAIRVAIGASRRHVIRQLLVESTLLALLSGSGGVLLAHWLTSLLRSALTMASAANIPVGVDGRVLAFGLLASLATALVCGLAPALRASRPHLTSALNEASGILTLLTRRWSLRNLMVVIQVALTMIVLAFGAPCVRSLDKLRVADPGYDTTKILAAAVKSKRQPGSGHATRQLFTDLKDRVEAFPGVAAVCLANDVPLTLDGRNKTGIERIEGFQMPPDTRVLSLDFSRVGPGYFRTLGVPLLRGRDFTSQDGPGAAKVMIVNELFAQRFWPNQDPIGKCVTFVTKDVREVIGVVGTVKLHSIQMQPYPLMFWPFDQPESIRSVGDFEPVLLVRTTGDPTVVAGLVRKEMESAGLGPREKNRGQPTYSFVFCLSWAADSAQGKPCLASCALNTRVRCTTSSVVETGVRISSWMTLTGTISSRPWPKPARKPAGKCMPIV
jgi:predicted permease